MTWAALRKITQCRIAEAVGVDQSTVVRDTRSIGAGDADASPAPAATITGRDGKQYPARRPSGRIGRRIRPFVDR